jgi:hypothetical protein
LSKETHRERISAEPLQAHECLSDLDLGPR